MSIEYTRIIQAFLSLRLKDLEFVVRLGYIMSQKLNETRRIIEIWFYDQLAEQFLTPFLDLSGPWSFIHLRILK